MVLNEADDIRLGTTQMDKVYLGDTQVWPTSQPITYVITSAYVYYTGDGLTNRLYASGLNYAYVLGTVEVRQGGTVIQTLTNVTLTPTVGSSQRIFAQGYYIYAQGLGTTPYNSETVSVTASYPGASPYSVSGGVTQEGNQIEGTTYEYNTVYDTAHRYSTWSPVAGTYFATITSSKYTSTATACYAGGNGSAGENILTIVAGHTEQETVHTPYTTYRRPKYTWTSTSQSYGEWTTYTTGVEDTTGEDTTVADTPSISVSDNYFTISGTNVKIPSEGTTPYNDGRSVLITATNNTGSGSVRIYQEANAPGAWTYVDDITLSMPDVSGNIPQAGGTFDVDYTSRRDGTRTWASGATETTSNAPIISEVTGTNCTPSVNTVTNGSGTFTITVPANNTQGLQVSVTLSSQGRNPVTLTKTQEYVPTGTTFTLTGAAYNSDKTSVVASWSVVNPYWTSTDFYMTASVDNTPAINHGLMVVRNATGSTTFNLATEFPGVAFITGVPNTYEFAIYDNRGASPVLMTSQSFTITY